MECAKIEICDVSNTLKNLKIINGSNVMNINFLYLIGAYEVDNFIYLGAITEVKCISEIWNINKIEKIKVVQISKEGNDDVKELIEDSLKLCPLYFSTTNDLSLSLQLQMKKK